MSTWHVDTIIILGLCSTLLLDVIQYLRHRLWQHGWLDYAVLAQALWQHWQNYSRTGHVHTRLPMAWARLLGWLLHYVIGVALVWLAMQINVLRGAQTLGLPFCLMFGSATVLLPFFIMQPLLGMGIAARNTATPWSNRGKSLIAHGLFGLSVYVAAQLLY